MPNVPAAASATFHTNRLAKLKHSDIVASMQKLLKRLFTGKTNITNQSLRKWNIVFAALYVFQGGALLLLSARWDFPVTASFLTKDSLQSELTKQTVTAPAMHQLFVVNIAYLVVAVLFIAALAHLLVATLFRTAYEAGLKGQVRRGRWILYAIDGSLMLMAISALVGIYDVGSLLFVTALAVLASLGGLMVETLHATNKVLQKPKRLSWIIAGLVGGSPWVVFGLAIIAANIFGSWRPEPYIYALYGAMLILFAGVAKNMYLQLTKRGKWANYPYAERWYMILGLAAKSVFAWLVFVGILHS